MEKLKKVSPFRLSSLIRLEKDPKLALQLFLNPNPGQTHNASPIRYSLLSYDRIICKLGRAKMFDEMETILEKLKEDTRVIPKEVIFCNVISFYGRARMPERAIRTFHRIPDFRCPRTMNHAIPMESRKVMKMEASLMMMMNALPKGDVPPSSPSDKGHDNGDSAVSGHGGLPSVQSHVDRNLESVPSPTIGN
nr:putative pentatricopeptide repeat-containing protein At1g53330 [Ipomoea trifida]